MSVLFDFLTGTGAALAAALDDYDSFWFHMERREGRRLVACRVHTVPTSHGAITLVARRKDRRGLDLLPDNMWVQWKCWNSDYFYQARVRPPGTCGDETQSGPDISARHG